MRERMEQNRGGGDARGEKTTVEKRRKTRDPQSMCIYRTCCWHKCTRKKETLQFVILTSVDWNIKLFGIQIHVWNAVYHIRHFVLVLKYSLKCSWVLTSKVAYINVPSFDGCPFLFAMRFHTASRRFVKRHGEQGRERRVESRGNLLLLQLSTLELYGKWTFQPKMVRNLLFEKYHFHMLNSLERNTDAGEKWQRLH